MAESLFSLSWEGGESGLCAMRDGLSVGEVKQGIICMASTETG